MRKDLLVLSLLLIAILLPVVSAQEDKTICVTYFTYIGCPNCAYTDPIVLTEWTEKYPNLVVIEYMWHGGDWQDPNSPFFGEYAKEYKTQAAVPQLVFDKNNIKLGRLDVPTAEEDIKTKESNPCPLLDKSIPFKKLNLKELKAKPKIWSNGRVLIKQDDNWIFQWNGEKVPKNIIGNKIPNNSLAKDLLFTDNISETLEGIKFEIVEPQRAEFSGVAFPNSEFIPYAEFENAIKLNISGTPLVNESVEVEEGNKTEEVIFETPLVNESVEVEEGNKTEEIKEIIEIPFFGEIKTEESPLLTITIIFAIADGLTNPCGFFVLFFLLAALLGLAGARKRMLLVGGIFIFFFFIYYLLFMGVLLNVFLMGREIAILIVIAGVVCIFTGLLNIKDYFFFQKGLSLSLSKKRRLKLAERVKNLSLEKSVSALIIGTTIVASTISLVAIACSFGIPLAYTKILATKSLSYFQYYLYLLFYNLIYIIPMLTVVLIFVMTLGKRTFSKLWIRRLKLMSGLMILFLGSVLLYKYTLLENAFFIFGLIISAVILSGLIILSSETFRKFKGKVNN